jgi:hypothetical protein
MLNIVPDARVVDLTVGPTTATHVRARERLTALGIRLLDGYSRTTPGTPLTPSTRVLVWQDTAEIRLQSSIAFEYTVIDTGAGETTADASVIWHPVSADVEVAIPVSLAHDRVYVRASGAGTVYATLLGNKGSFC